MPLGLKGVREGLIQMKYCTNKNVTSSFLDTKTGFETESTFLYKFSSYCSRLLPLEIYGNQL